MEVFMDDFSVFGNSFQTCLSHLENMLKWCEDTNLCLNWEKSHFPIKLFEGVYMARKPLTFSRLAIIDPSGDIMARTTLPRSVKERFRNLMNCRKIPSKFAKFLTFGASISWVHSRIHEGTANVFTKANAEGDNVSLDEDMALELAEEAKIAMETKAAKSAKAEEEPEPVNTIPNPRNAKKTMAEPQGVQSNEKVPLDTELIPSVSSAMIVHSL
nr:reverse transcriptase domain-containing protein [Tanacetum cinerariifolium]